MTRDLTVSVVIVSRDRPKALRRCLMGMSQLDYTPFELIIVADPASCAALRNVPQAAFAKVIAFDEANISAARNVGITAASGEIIAFIDDDSVPEPTWLTFLVAPFSDPTVAASGGFVRGRNGISWQSRARAVDRTGHQVPLVVDAEKPTVLTAKPGRAIKTEGTNMAIRQACLVELGGFDPRFRFFLDETDLNLRLAAKGLSTAISPRAEVHHGFAPSGRRRLDRVPTDLFEIGASWAVFLGKHAGPADAALAWARVQATERRRALKHLVSGGVEPRDVRRLMDSLRAGYRDGQNRAAPQNNKLSENRPDFRPFPSKTVARSHLISGRVWSRRKQRSQAKQQVTAGEIVTVLRFSPTALYHHIVFRDDGYWEQTGGLFGKSERSQKVLSLWWFAERVRAEASRVQVVRKLCKQPAIKQAQVD